MIKNRAQKTQYTAIRLLSLLFIFGIVTNCTSPTAEPPTISDPVISDPTPQEPGKEVGISIDVSSAGGATLTYTWNADGGEIVRGQGSPAITYRVPQEPGTYNVRVRVEWDGQSTEKVTSIHVEGSISENTPEPVVNTPPSTDAPSIPISAPYDDFNNPEHDGDFDHYLWEFWHPNWEGVVQEDGSLRIQSGLPTSLVAREHNQVLVTSATYYEASIKMNDDAIGGSATLQLHIDISDNKYWGTQCGLLVPDILFCELGTKDEDQAIYKKEERIDVTTWHRFRIEINPENKRVNYYVDGDLFGKANIPVNENGRYSLVIGVFPVSGNTLAYFDDVDFGER